ncbi:MAG: uroporphyrinogen-III C-methyltransferase [Coriobacteriia bacterium]|nr:uroporphyrinogen-III C-methyltransferase [Coriobacteriia bacterium]
MFNPKVYLVGSGPGDPGLLSVKAKELLQNADILVYDFLVSSQILDLVREDAELVYVGKKGFSKHISQEEINEILLELAKENPEAIIVRLKGGDPYVFGRGSEEGLVLAKAGIPFELVPGITSGMAALAYAGIPATHRNISSSVAFITGHEDPSKEMSSINWEHLAQGVDTLVFYMGVKNIELIARNLLKYGRSPDEPVALVRWGTNPQQETLVSDLEHVAQEVQEKGFSAPSVICVGKVVNLRDDLNFFESKPLHHKTIVVTRARSQASSMTRELCKLGAHVIEFPTIKIEFNDIAQELLDFISHRDEYSWLVLTSVNGVEALFQSLLVNGYDARVLSGIKVASIGSATAQALMDYGIVPDLIPEEYRAESLVESLEEHNVAQGGKVLLVRASEARSLLIDELEKLGASTHVIDAYETVIDESVKLDELAEKLKANEIDLISFTASSTVKNFMYLLEKKFTKEEVKEVLAKPCLASIGPITSDTLRRYGFEPGLEAKEFTIPQLISQIEDYYQNKQ